MVECTAPNKCMQGRFNAKDYYCVQYNGFKDMTQYEKDKHKKTVEKKYVESEFRQYANKYYTKKEAKEMIEERKKWTK